MPRFCDELRSAKGAKLFTDAEALAARAGKVLAHEKVLSATSHRYFDLASLTKPLCTGLLLQLSWQEKMIAPKDEIRRFFGGKAPRGVTVGGLLNHTAGLEPWRDFFAEVPTPRSQAGFARNRRAIIKAILARKTFRGRPGKTVYSDLGYILLGAILEKIHGERLDLLYRRIITEPLGIADDLFFPTSDQHKTPGARRFVPGETCSRRGRVMQGEVMDENAWVMGGVSGHAGLFGTARAIHRVLTELRKARYGGSRLFGREAFVKFLLPPGRKPQERCFTVGGFDTPTLPGSQAGGKMSATSIGHLGYSGASFWWDLDRDAWIILLANRCHAGRKNRAFAAWRPGFHDAIMTRINPKGLA